jgi:hypothetical protein
MLKPVITVLIVTFAMTTTANRAEAVCAARTKISGEWKGDDGGTYYFRWAETGVWWVGLSPGGGDAWTNVFSGTYDARTKRITGNWSDVRSAGGYKDGKEKQGQITLELIGAGPDKEVQGFKKVQGTGWNFGATNWFAKCNDN